MLKAVFMETDDKKTVLVVDDDFASLKSIIDILDRDTNFRILQSNSAEGALRIAGIEKLSLIVTDWEMPYMSGYDFLKEMKNDEDLKNIPVIMATGVRTDSTDLQKAFEAGVIDFIRKPFDAIELRLRVEAVLKLVSYQEEIIKQKNKELALHATYMLQMHKRNLNFLRKSEKLYQSIKKEPENSLKHVYDLVKNMNATVLMSKSDNLEQYFEELQPNFTKRLVKEYPDLTPSEIRLSILLRMNMDSKTIASVLHKTEGSVRTARKRLREKFKLDRSDNITAFINRV